MYMRSLKLPNMMSGGVSLRDLRTASLSGFTPARREKENVQGSPISVSRKWRMPRA